MDLTNRSPGYIRYYFKKRMTNLRKRAANLEKFARSNPDNVTESQKALVIETKKMIDKLQDFLCK